MSGRYSAVHSEIVCGIYAEDVQARVTAHRRLTAAQFLQGDRQIDLEEAWKQTGEMSAIEIDRAVLLAGRLDRER